MNNHLSSLIRLLSAGNFTIGMGAFVVIGILNPMADDLNLQPDQAGWVLTFYAIAYAVGSPIGVTLTGTWSRRTVLVLGIGLFGIAAIFSALASNPQWLFAARIVAAFGAGLYTPVAAAVVAANCPTESRGKALAAVFFGITLAQVLGVPAGSFVAYTFSWPWAFWIVAILSIAVSVFIWWQVPKEVNFTPTKFSDLGAVLTDWRGLLVVAFTILLVSALYVPYTYMAPLLSQTMLYGRDGLTLVLAVFGCGAVVGNWVGGQMTDRIGASWTLIIVAIAQVISLPVFSILPIPDWLLLFFVFTWSVLGWSFMTPQQFRLVAYDPNRQSILLSFNASAIYIGASIGSALGGYVILHWGVSTLGVVGGVTALLATASLWISERITKVTSSNFG